MRRPSGRKPVHARPMRRVQCYLPHETWEDARRAAYERGKSLSQVIADLLDQWRQSESDK